MLSGRRSLRALNLLALGLLLPGPGVDSATLPPRPSLTPRQAAGARGHHGRSLLPCGTGDTVGAVIGLMASVATADPVAAVSPIITLATEVSDCDTVTLDMFNQLVQEVDDNKITARLDTVRTYQDGLQVDINAAAAMFADGSDYYALKQRYLEGGDVTTAELVDEVDESTDFLTRSIEKVTSKQSQLLAQEKALMLPIIALGMVMVVTLDRERASITGATADANAADARAGTYCQYGGTVLRQEMRDFFFERGCSNSPQFCGDGAMADQLRGDVTYEEYTRNTMYYYADLEYTGVASSAELGDRTCGPPAGELKDCGEYHYQELFNPGTGVCYLASGLDVVPIPVLQPAGADPCAKCNLPEEDGGCKCDDQCACLVATDVCAKCNLAEEAGGCKCDDQCACL